MDFEEFAALPSVKQREREFVRMQWKSFETLEEIKKILEKIAVKE